MRPSFVLASTVQTDDPTGDPSALARSEPGRAAVASAERTGESPGPSDKAPARGKVVVPVVALAVITLALAAGWKAREHSGSDPAPSTHAAVSLAPVASAPPPASMTAPLALDDAGPAPSASAPVAPSASASARVATSASAPHRVPTVVVRPSATASPTKPVPSSDVAPRVPPRPSATVHDDPLF